jgi:hypothetical protein
LSDQLGISAESVQRLSFAFAQGGATQEDFVKGTAKLVDNMQSARDGSETAIKSFAKLGISLDEINNLSTEQMLVRIADGMKEADDPTRNLAAAMDLLGKSGRNLVPTLKEGGDELKKYMREARALTDQQVHDIEAASQKAENFAKQGLTNVLSGAAQNATNAPGLLKPGGAIVGAGAGVIDSLFGTSLTVPPQDFDSAGRMAEIERMKKEGMNDQPALPNKAQLAQMEEIRKEREKASEEASRARERDAGEAEAANRKTAEAARALRFLQMNDLQKLAELYREVRDLQADLGQSPDDGTSVFAEKRASLAEKWLEFQKELKTFKEGQDTPTEEMAVPELRDTRRAVAQSIQLVGGGGNAKLFGSTNAPEVQVAKEQSATLKRIESLLAKNQTRADAGPPPAKLPAFNERR